MQDMGVGMSVCGSGIDEPMENSGVYSSWLGMISVTDALASGEAPRHFLWKTEAEKTGLRQRLRFRV